MKNRLILFTLVFIYVATNAQNIKNDLVVTGGWGLNIRSINQTLHYELADYWSYNANADLNLTKRAWVGLGFTYQEFENYKRFHASYSEKNYWNVRGRLLVDLVNRPCFEIYTCLAAGFTYDGEEYGYIRYQLQGVAGTRYYLNEAISLNLEAGVGYPYFASAGISYRIRKSK